MKNLFVCAMALACVSHSVHANDAPSKVLSSFGGTSTAELRESKGVNALISTNTRFEGYYYPNNFDPKVAFPGNKQIKFEWRLLKTKQTTQVEAGAEGGCDPVAFDLYEPKSKKRLWNFKDCSNSHEVWDRYFTLTTQQGGDCQNSYRAYSFLTGGYLFPFSFLNKIKFPIVLRADAFNPNGFRFIGFQGTYWPCRDTKFKVKDAGSGKKESFVTIISYASPLKLIEQVGLVFNGSLFKDDPADDPDSVEVISKWKTWTFKPNGKDYEAEYWFRKNGSTYEPETDPAKRPVEDTYSGLALRLHFGKDWVEIPIEKDRLDLEHVTASTKETQKLVEVVAE